MASSLAAQAILATAEKGLNKLLQLDPIALEQLAQLAGKVIAIHSTTPTYTFFIIFTEQGLYLCSENDATPNSRVTATTPLLFQWLLTKHKQNLIADSRLTLEGETDIVYAFCKLLDNLNPDWQYELSEWFGPAIASLMIESAKMGSQQLQVGFNFIQQQLSSFVEKVTPTMGNQALPKNPFNDFLSLLQKKFGQS